MPAYKVITARQKIFCELYLNPSSGCCGNATKSYQKAGFTAINAGRQSYLLLQKSEIKEYIAKLEEKRLSSLGVMSKDDYVQEGLETIRELPRSSSVRVKYYDIVGRVLGFFTENSGSQILIYNENSSSENEDLRLKSKLFALTKKIKSQVNNNSDNPAAA